MTKVVVIVCFIMAFVAGLLVGWQTRPQVAVAPDNGAPATTQRSSRGPTGWLVRELNLDDAQREQLEKIWSETARQGRGERDDRRRELRRERDEAIAALVRPEDYGKYDQILKHYVEKTDAIDREMRATFDEAVEKTKLILTEEQRTKYEQLLKRHRPDDRDGRGGRDDRDRDEKDRDDRDRDDKDRDKNDKDKKKSSAREQSSRRGDDFCVTPRPGPAPIGVTPL